MLFNTVQFAAFFVAVVAVYWRLPHRARTVLLLVGSYFFYGYWDWRFLSLLGISTVVDYNAGLYIARTAALRARRFALMISICVNLGLLGFFKYFNFFAENLHVLLQSLGVPSSMPTLNIILPVGISFYTFQTMSYTIDIYRGKMKPTRDILDFALFVSFFPQLVAGPIERARNLLPQMSQVKTFNSAMFSNGLELMAWGFFKKMFVADNVAGIADRVFTTPTGDQTGLELLLGVYAFAIQIYCDFSGYSDIARGAARCLGFDLMVNFRVPYFTTNPQEFWNRWHISLSSWLRDYLYFSLGGNRGGPRKTYRNLIATMVLGGLWHGAAWTFVLWGVYQGTILIIHRLFCGRKQPDKDATDRGWLGSLGRALGMVLFFQVVCGGWILFRAETVSQVWGLVTGIFLQPFWGPVGVQYGRIILFCAWFLFVADLIWFLREKRCNQSEDMPRLAGGPISRVILFMFAISSVVLFGAFDAQSFIYFQF